MSGLTEMTAAGTMAGVLLSRGLRKSSVLLLVIVGALSISRIGGSELASSSPSLFAEDIDQLAQPAYLALSNRDSRHLLQAVDNDTTTTNAPFLLARSRTDRPNPLKGLKKYTGGYNLSSVNYGASVGYTGLPGWISAIVWAALGLILLLTLCCMCCCCRHRAGHEYTHGWLGYIIPIIALIIFSLAAIAGSIILYHSQQKFNRELMSTLNYVVNQSETTEAGLREVQSNLTSAANINIPGVFTLPDSAKSQIASLNVQLNNTAHDLQSKTVDNRKKIHDGINIVRIVLIVVAAVMLALVLLGLLFSALGVRSLVYILVLLGWVLVLGTWILCGIFIFLENGVGDTCLAMHEWVEHPQANTSLDKWLPCDGSAAASALSDSETYTVEIVSGINNFLTNTANLNPPPPTNPSNLGSWYNQTGPAVPTVCFNTTPCPADSTTLANATTAWQSFVCNVNANATGNAALICATQGRLTPSFYTQLSSAAEDAESFTTSATFLASAANCTFVATVFENIFSTRCHNLRMHTKWIWIGLILVSAGTMLSILLWIVFIRRKRYRYKYNKQQQPRYKNVNQPYSPPPPPGSISPAA